MKKKLKLIMILFLIKNQNIQLEKVRKLRYYLIHHKIFFGNKLSGKHRKSDIYWSTDDYIILNCIMFPGNPPLYKVKNLKTSEIPNALYRTVADYLILIILNIIDFKISNQNFIKNFQFYILFLN